MIRVPHRLLLCLLLVLVATAVYLPGLSGGFIFDDFSNIVDNPGVHAESLDVESLRKAIHAYAPGDYGRPLATLTFAIDHALGGVNPYGYKISSLLVHVLNSLLVLALVLSLLRASGQAADREAWIMAFAVALLWAIHPLQVSTVLYVVQRMETLSLTFVLLALLAYLKGRAQQISGQTGWPWLLLCLPSMVLGLLSKETAILFPVYALALELTVLGFHAHRPGTASAWKILYAACVVVAVLIFVFFAWPRYGASLDYNLRNFTVGERLLTQLRILPMYLGQMLLPMSRSLWFYYDNYPVSHGLLNPVSTLLSAGLLAALLALAVVLRKRVPLVALGILWFFAAHLLTSNIIPLELAFEHRNYFALLGILLAVADLIRRIRLRDGPLLKYVAVGAVIIGFGTLSTIRAATWGNRLLLATEHTHINPGSGRAAGDMAAIYLEMADGNMDSPFQYLALREFERGAALPGSSVVNDQGLLLVATASKQVIKPEWWNHLIDKLRNENLQPETTGAMFDLLGNRRNGVPLSDEKLTEAFMAMFSRADFPPNSYASFGDYLLNVTNNQKLADATFIKAIEASREYPFYAKTIVTTLKKQGHERQATLALARAKELGLVEKDYAP